MIALTFDTDYMWEDGLVRFVEMFPFPGRATFFLWQPFRDLELGAHELAPHPFLSDERSWRTAIDDFEQAWNRTARVMRPHSCVYSHMLGIELFRRGYRGISQVTSLAQKGLRPYRHPWGIWELPIYYMDSMDMTFARNWPSLGHRPFDPQIIDAAIRDRDSLFVFDFHPIHVVLNTSSFDQYQSIKAKVVEERRSPFDLAFPGAGCRTFFESFLERLSSSGASSRSCGDIVADLDRATEA